MATTWASIADRRAAGRLVDPGDSSPLRPVERLGARPQPTSSTACRRAWRQLRLIPPVELCAGSASGRSRSPRPPRSSPRRQSCARRHSIAAGLASSEALVDARPVTYARRPCPSPRVFRREPLHHAARRLRAGARAPRRVRAVWSRATPSRSSTGTATRRWRPRAGPGRAGRRTPERPSRSPRST